MGSVGNRCVLSGALAAVTAMSGIRVTVDPTSATGVEFGQAGNVTTNVVTIQVVPPTGPYSYSWVYVSGDSTLTVLAPAGPSTAFRQFLEENSSTFAYYKARVTFGGVNYDSEPFFVQLSRYS